MRAIIMAGGGGKRLRPLTCTMPKPMAPILDRPIIDYALALCRRHGIEDITVTLQYLPQRIKRHLGEAVRYSVEDRPLGTAGSVKLAAGRVKEDILVLSGDALTDMDLSAAIKAHREKGAAVTIVLTRVAVPTEYGVVLTDGEGRVSRFLEKPQLSEVFSDLANTGIYILSPQALEMIPPEQAYDFSSQLFPKLLEQGLPLYGFFSESYWCDVGNLGQFVQAQGDVLSGKCRPPFRLPQREAGVYVEAEARIDKRAVLMPPCYIGAGAEVGEKAIIGPGAVIGRGARVGAGSSVKRSVLLPGARIRENVELRGCIVSEEAELERGAMVFDGAAVGAKAVVEEGACIKPGVSVWPERRVEANSVLKENLIWERGRRTVRSGGFSDSDLCPEQAARMGAAFGSILGLPGAAVVATDGSMQSCMLRYSFLGGLLSQGVDAYDMGKSTPSAAAYSVVNLGLAGGAYIFHDPGTPHRAEVRLLDKQGLALPGEGMRRFEQALDAGLHPITRERLGLVLGSGDGARAYEASLVRANDLRPLESPVTLVVAGPEAVFDTVSRVLLPFGYRVLYGAEWSGDSLFGAMAHAGAQLGFRVERGLESLFLGERELGFGEICTIIMLHALENGRLNRFDLPVTVPEEYANLLRSRGGCIKRVFASPDKWRREMKADGCDDAALTEPEAGIVRLAAIHARDGGQLERYAEMLPKLHLERGSVGCSWREMGRVLRSLVETEKSQRMTLLDGISVADGEGWVLVRPETLREYRVVAGSMNAEYAKELCGLYLDKIRRIVEKGEGH